MAEPSFADSIAKERERLRTKREGILAEQQKLTEQLHELDRELKAIDAYEAVKQGKDALPRTPRSASNGSRPPRGEKRELLVQLLAQHPDGLARGEIIEKLGGKGDKSAEQSISNALSALKKQNKLGSKDGKYVSA